MVFRTAVMGSSILLLSGECNLPKCEVWARRNVPGWCVSAPFSMQHGRKRLSTLENTSVRSVRDAVDSISGLAVGCNLAESETNLERMADKHEMGWVRLDRKRVSAKGQGRLGECGDAKRPEDDVGVYSRRIVKVRILGWSPTRRDTHIVEPAGRGARLLSPWRRLKFSFGPTAEQSSEEQRNGTGNVHREAERSKAGEACFKNRFD